MSPVVMHELEGVTPETAVDPKELKELIARLANPNHGAPKGSVQVKDIAETLELDESEVARQLVALRKSKETQVAPVRAEKMAAMLDSLKTSDFQPLTNQPLKRVTLMSVLAIVVLFGAFVLIAFSLSQSQPIAPPQRIRADISKAIPEVAPKAP